MVRDEPARLRSLNVAKQSTTLSHSIPRPKLGEMDQVGSVLEEAFRMMDQFAPIVRMVAGEEGGNAKGAFKLQACRPLRLLRQCQTNLKRNAKGASLRCSGRKLTPFGQSGRSVLLEDIAAVEMAVLVELIVD